MVGWVKRRLGCRSGRGSDPTRRDEPGGPTRYADAARQRGPTNPATLGHERAARTLDDRDRPLDSRVRAELPVDQRPDDVRDLEPRAVE